MRVTRLYLRNYRVYEDPVELELPPGLVGIYGPNGAGKSLLVESIRWTLYGRSRTAIDEIRTAQVNADCITEVEFEHEGHLYLVRRMLTGINSTVKASAHADNLQVAEGARDVTRYVHSVLGMDDAAFRASVFAEQKQLDAFSDQTPADRRRLVLQLLGITPVDAARDEARKQARDTRDRFEKLRSLLPDLESAGAEAEAAAGAALVARQQAVAAAEAAVKAREALEVAQRRCDDLDRLRQEHELVDAELRAARADHQRSVARAQKLAAELGELEVVAARIADLRLDAEGLRAVEVRLRMVDAWVEARAAVGAVQVPLEPPRPDVDGVEQATQVAQSAREELARTKALLGAARAELDRARQAVARSSELSAEGACPLCGQALGAAFEQVRAHRAGDLAAVEARLADLDATCRAEAELTRAATGEAERRRQALQSATAQWSDYERAAQRRADAAARMAAVQAELGDAVGDGEHARLTAEVERRRKAAEELQRAQGRLERRPSVESDLESERMAAADALGRVETLAEKLTAMRFDPAKLTEVRTTRDRLRAVADDANTSAQAAQLAAAQADTRAEAAAERKRRAEEQHAQLAQLGDDARHLGRLADLLSTFRNELVSTAGPRLSVQAAELFAELTDNEYDRLEVDADTYEIRVRDAGLLYGMHRFSGSETDLANLALRVAIAEQVRFQAGGAVGLLVLDEVFGPLDEDRKERMLLALERLRARFRQVLVVTHDATIKEQLPNAIEVVKLPGRRATARLVHA